MVLDPIAAEEFIEGYKAVLLTIEGASMDLSGQPLLQALHAGRERLLNDPGLLDTALEELRAQSLNVTDAVSKGLRTLRVENWIYLRDTRSYSIFLDMNEEAGYGVLGLTDRLRDIIGDSGMVMITGLLCYQGRYICDGIIANVVMLGNNYRASFTESYREFKKKGRFYVKCG